MEPVLELARGQTRIDKTTTGGVGARLCPLPLSNFNTGAEVGPLTKRTDLGEKLLFEGDA